MEHGQPRLGAATEPDGLVLTTIREEFSRGLHARGDQTDHAKRSLGSFFEA